MSSNPTQLDEWKALEKKDPVKITAKFEKLHLKLDGLLFDYSKQDIDEEILSALIALATACDVEKGRNALFAGEPVNVTEKRPALHTDLRKPEPPAEVKATLERMKDLQEKIWKSDIKDIVHLGIGGSDLGPHMVCEALKSFSNRDLNIHFVSNIDPSHLTETLRNLKPDTTLFIIASKSFTTDETMTNAKSALEWSGVIENFIVVTAASDKAQNFGITEDKIFPLWDWVGGRYSLWSAIGLPICLSLGFENFRKLLDGAHAMDEHFQSAPLDKNIPVIMALLGIWHRNFCDRSTAAILPYNQYLHLLPAYLQQLEMESNGKSIDNDGNPVSYKTAPVIFGQSGTNGQHAFYQLIHQGTDIIPCDFIVPVKSQNPLGDHHQKLIANAIGQSQALMQGQKNSAPYKNFDGNRPSTTILLDEVDPFHLGMLLALYEHKVFVQSLIWNINCFDQWGVELGKTLAQNIFSGKLDALDPSSKALLTQIQSGKTS